MGGNDRAANPTGPYAEGLARGVLRYQCCTACGAAQTLARYACTRCGGTALIWRDAAGTGTVYSATVVMRAPSDAFRALVPYTLVLVDLDEGPRLMAHAEAGVRIGDRVRAAFFHHAGTPLARFHLLAEGAAPAVPRAGVTPTDRTPDD